MHRYSVILAALSLAGSALAQVEPGAGQWTTLVIPTGSAFRLAPPPAKDATIAEIQQVKDLATKRTPDSLSQIHYWDAGAPSYRWMQMTQALVISKGLAGPFQTRALALVAAAIYDAMVASWDSKYTWS